MTSTALPQARCRRCSSASARLSVLLALVPLAFILFFVVSQGIQCAQPRFLHAACRSRSARPGGGMANAIVGTLILTGLGVADGGADRHRRAASTCRNTRAPASRRAVRFAADTLNGVPSIVIGVFAYGVAVLPFKQFSALAGGFALGMMMIPIIARTTEELLLLVPGTMREGALALGATRARAVFTVVLPAALPGIITGVVLALARIAGETAPLLFTSFNNRFFTTKPAPADLVADRAGLHLRDLAVRGLAPPGTGPARSSSSRSSSSARYWRASRRAASSGCTRARNQVRSVGSYSQAIADGQRAQRKANFSVSLVHFVLVHADMAIVVETDRGGS